MFNEESYIVKVWVKNVRSGQYQRGQVPNLSNLQEVVDRLLNGHGEA